MNNNAVENSFNETESIINNQPRYPESIKDMGNNYAAEADCPNFELCNKLQITHENVCTKDSDTRVRCSFGESRFIMLLGRLISHKEKEN
jgi:hypothetical protein